MGEGYRKNLKIRRACKGFFHSLHKEVFMQVFLLSTYYCGIKGVTANQDHMCDFFITFLSQLHMITEVNTEYEGTFGLPKSSHAGIIFFPYTELNPNFEPFVFSIVRNTFKLTYDLHLNCSFPSVRAGVN